MIRRVIIRPATETSMFKDSVHGYSSHQTLRATGQRYGRGENHWETPHLADVVLPVFAAISQFIVKINSLIGSPCFLFRHFGSSKSSFQFSVDKETDRYTVLSASTINNSVYLIETNAYLKLISLINNHQNGLNDLLISIY